MITCEKRNVFKRVWIMPSILLLDAIHETKWTSGDDRLKILDSRNALLIHYDNTTTCSSTFQDPLLDIEAYVKSVEEKEGEEVWMQELESIIDALAEKLSKAGSYVARAMMTEYFKTLTQMHHRWANREGNEAQATPIVIQRLLAKAQIMNLHVVGYIKSTENADELAMMAFGEATKMLVTCIGRFPQELLPRELIQEILGQQKRILDVSATPKVIVSLAAPLTESYARLREYSAKHHGQEGPLSN